MFPSSDGRVTLCWVPSNELTSVIGPGDKNFYNRMKFLYRSFLLIVFIMVYAAN
jgi:hypothetical protein